MTFRKRVFFALIVPLMVMGAWYFRWYRIIKSEYRVEFAVAGYDPRDLLSGHFLNFKVELGSFEPSICSNFRAIQGVDTCVCVGKSDGSKFDQALSSHECGSQSCEVFLKGSCDSQRFRADNLNVFYFDEKYSRLLAVIPPNASIVVHVNGRGDGLIKDFKVDGMPYQDWVKRR